MQSSPAVKCKIVLLGDQSVGKTSIINRFIFDNFTGNQQPTVGVDFVSKTVNVDQRSLRMQLWDTAGQQRFISLIPSYVKDCSAAVIVYDITNANSFTNLNKWIDNVREVRGDEALILVIGNKTDLEEERNVDREQAKAKLDELDIFSMEVSAKNGTNIKEFFKELAWTVSGGRKKKNNSEKTSEKVSETQPRTEGNVDLRQAVQGGQGGGRKNCPC